MNINFSQQPRQNFCALPKWQSVVDERLVRGPRVSCPWRLYQMKQEGINQIVDLRNCSYVKRPMEKLFCKLFGIKYVNYRYSHKDINLPSDDFFKRVNNTILENEGKTYIHCQRGKRRTGVCVAIYEKLHTSKSDCEIVDNLIGKGFKSISKSCSSKKAERIKTIYNSFMEKYFPDLTP